MIRNRPLVPAWLALAWLVLSPAAGAQAAVLPDTIDEVRRSIVAIGTIQPTRRPPARFLATGFVVGDGKHVITNAHVVPRKIDNKKKEYLAVFMSGRKSSARRAEVVRIDNDHDVALLRIGGKQLPPMALGRSKKVREGELYAFTGFPVGEVLGLRPVTHTGIISAITPIAIPQLSGSQLNPEMIKRLRSPYDVYQLDATAYPGNSGSPLYDPATGQVVGVINKVFIKESKENVLEKPSGITYAIPIRFAEKLLRKAGLLDPSP